MHMQVAESIKKTSTKLWKIKNFITSKTLQCRIAKIILKKYALSDDFLNLFKNRKKFQALKLSVYNFGHFVNI